nr:RecName: Full=Photosystem I reaction center subunit IV; Short=PSI-E; AltName: Full=Photosystem I 13 kDa protein [Pisum sativum]
ASEDTAEAAAPSA